MNKNFFIVISVLLLISSCTWVKPTLMGEEVKLVDQGDKILETCKKLGSMTTMVKHKVGSINRSIDKVNTELITIAKNEAAEMDGDTIAAEGPVKDGRRAFGVYKCGN